jgi:hypothetical protein
MSLGSSSSEYSTSDQKEQISNALIPMNKSDRT